MLKHNYKIYFLVRSYKSFEYFDKCIDSIFKQRYKEYKIIFVDDASNYTIKIKNHIRKKLKNHIVIFNKERKYSLRNAYELIHRYTPDNAIIINVDGDDWLIGTDVIDIIISTYKKTNCDLTYGNCKYFNPGSKNHKKTPLELSTEINRRFPEEIDSKRSYRNYYFLPLHLRTWKAKNFKKIKKINFLRPNGDWIRFCEDQAIFYPLLEQKGNYAVINKVLYSYNISTPISDNKVNNSERLYDEICIRKKT